GRAEQANGRRLFARAAGALAGHRHDQPENRPRLSPINRTAHHPPPGRATFAATYPAPPRGVAHDVTDRRPPRPPWPTRATNRGQPTHRGALPSRVVEGVGGSGEARDRFP